MSPPMQIAIERSINHFDSRGKLSHLRGENMEIRPKRGVWEGWVVYIENPEADKHKRDVERRGRLASSTSFGTTRLEILPGVRFDTNFTKVSSNRRLP